MSYTSPLLPLPRSVRARAYRDYRVQMVDDLERGGSRLLFDRVGTRSSLLVTTPTVYDLYAQKIGAPTGATECRPPILVLDCTEQTKVLSQVERVCAAAEDAAIGRSDVLVAIGGGVCTDIVTCAASWIRRGINHIRIPTTLIGQIDAGVGIKGAVNFCLQKNRLGCFHPPEMVLVDPGLLPTLPPRQIRCGLAEVLKISIVRDPGLFDLIERHGEVLISSRFAKPRSVVRDVLWRSIERMLDELEENLYEDLSYERLVDFGHTFSPELEAASAFRLQHGEAVAIDIALSCCLAERLGLLDTLVRDRILKTIAGLGLPLWWPRLDGDLCWKALHSAALNRGGAPNLVLPHGMGRAGFLKDLAGLPPDAVTSAIETLRRFDASIARCVRAGQ